MAGNKRVPEPVQNAINNCRELPDWDVSIRNEKVQITAPDGIKLTVGMSPNDESLKKFIREATKYNLIVGPPATPAQQAAALAEAERAGLEEATRRNAQRKAFEAEQAAKKREIEAAQAKARAATEKGMVSVKAAPDAGLSAKGFPAFDSSLMGVIDDYSKFKLASGRYYCIECLSEGTEADFKAPQGLATHRGFRHQMYLGANGAPATQVEGGPLSALPEDVRTALDLLQVAVAEHTGGDPADAQRVKDLEATLATIRKQAEADMAQADKQYNEAKGAFDKALRVEKEKVHALQQELHGKDGLQKAETAALMKGFRVLLEDVQKIIESERPVQAVGKIDELLGAYLAG